MTRHRIFLVPTRPDVDVDVAIDHWELAHGAVFAATPGLGGYVQHRPTRPDQHRLGGRVCAEAFFADADAERRAWASDHYRGAVTRDEERFVDRAAAWAARVTSQRPLPRPAGPDVPVEVVAVGCDPAAVPDDVGGRVLEVDRDGPTGGPAVALILGATDLARARELVVGLPADVAFVSSRVAVLPPG